VGQRSKLGQTVKPYHSRYYIISWTFINVYFSHFRQCTLGNQKWCQVKWGFNLLEDACKTQVSFDSLDEELLGISHVIHMWYARVYICRINRWQIIISYRHPLQPPALAPTISQQVMSPATLGCIISLTTIHWPLLALIALQNILGQHLCWDNLNHLCLRLSACSNWYSDVARNISASF